MGAPRRSRGAVWPERSEEGEAAGGVAQGMARRCRRGCGASLALLSQEDPAGCPAGEGHQRRKDPKEGSLWQHPESGLGGESGRERSREAEWRPRGWFCVL